MEAMPVMATDAPMLEAMEVEVSLQATPLTSPMSDGALDVTYCKK